MRKLKRMNEWCGVDWSGVIVNEDLIALFVRFLHNSLI